MSLDKTYTSILRITPEKIALFNENELNDLMRDLFLAQAYRCKADRSKVCVNTEVKANDDGCDGWTPKPENDDVWLGNVETCWQFKTGDSGQPSKLKGEVLKKIPRETLQKGGRFVVVANASTSGVKGVEERREALVNEATGAGIPTSSIVVIDSERLATWCNEHPAIAARFLGLPEGLCPFSEWAKSAEHSVSWQSTQAIEDEMKELRSKVGFDNLEILHLHVVGRPGVGKSRFALELCRNAEWCNEVIYFNQDSDSRLIPLIDSVIANQETRLFIVIDEVQSERLKPLYASIERAKGRLRLITIGHEKTTDLALIPAKEILPLSNAALTNIVKGWWPAMPPEHVEYVVRISDGYVRLARLISESVMKNPSANLAELFNQDHIRAFLDNMLGAEDKRSLHVLAVLSIVGWEGEVAEEGKAIAEHLNLDWAKVQYEVQQFHKKYGIAPYGGRYRYISPTPLGDYLALDAWDSYPELMKTLPSVLPGYSQNAYYDRMKNIVSNPKARRFAIDQLNFFLRIEDFMDEDKIQYWSIISSANPALAVKNVYNALKSSDNSKRLRIEGRARRNLINALVTLSWNAETFKDSVLSLALLADAENEKWANNSSAEFVSKYQISLGGTSVPYISRLEVIDELLTWNNEKITILVINALSKVGDQSEMRGNFAPFEIGAPEPEWHPRTGVEYLECVSQAVKRLIAISNTKNKAFIGSLIHTANHLSFFLTNEKTKVFTRDLFSTIGDCYPESKDSLSEILDDVIDTDVNFRKELKTEQIEDLENFKKKFEDLSLTARLKRIVTKHRFETIEEKDFEGMAKELLDQFSVLKQEWNWLTSDEAMQSWFLGAALELVSGDKNLESVLVSLPDRGSDSRFICGFLYQRAKRYGNDWLDAWLRQYRTDYPKDFKLVLEVCWRCDVSEKSIDIVIDILKNENVDKNVVSQLGFGRWSEKLSFVALSDFLNVLIDKNHIHTAIVTFHDRLKKYPDEVDEWSGVALKLLTNSQLIKDRQMGAYHWREVAFSYLEKFPTQITSSIFKVHGERDQRTWFIEHSDSAIILQRCAEVDPNGVWLELKKFISDKGKAYSFSIGFPNGILGLLPQNLILEWIDKEPEDRAALIVEMNGVNISSDETLTAKIIGKYADRQQLAYRFLSTFSSGAWVGEASDHWFGYAGVLDKIAETTKISNIKMWAEMGAKDLRQRAQQDLRNEEEEKLRGYRI